MAATERRLLRPATDSSSAFWLSRTPTTDGSLESLIKTPFATKRNEMAGSSRGMTKVDGGPCALCMQPATKRCQACETIFFCSKVCQTECWPQHRTKCKLIQHADSEIDLTVPKRFKYLYHDFGLRCYCATVLLCYCSEEDMALQSFIVCF